MTVPPVKSDLAPEPEGFQPAIDLREELDHRLATLGLFGREGCIEQILSYLHLPNLQPRTAIIVGPAQAGKTRLLTGLANMFRGQRLKVVEASCRPSDRQIPGALLGAIIYQLLTSFTPKEVTELFAPVVETQRWLIGLFPMLGRLTAPAPPPDDTREISMGLSMLLLKIVRESPMVAVIHSLHQADELSFAAFAALQEMDEHGLHLVGGVDPEGDMLPEAVRCLLTENSTVVELPPLTREQIAVYLQEVVPDLDSGVLGDALYAESGGYPLAIEMTLRTWAESSVLDYRDDKWTFDTGIVSPDDESGLNQLDRKRLGMAAVACPLSFDLLCELWHTMADDALATIKRGCALGFLQPIDENDPGDIAFIDQEHAYILFQELPPDERTNLHAQISALLETAPHSDDYALELSYHLLQAGRRQQAERYLRQLRLAVSTFVPILITPQAAVIGGSESWNIPPAMPIMADDLDPIVHAALAVRLAGVQSRLYPSTSEMVRSAVRGAMIALEALFTRRQSLIISFDGRNIAFDGQMIQRRDLSVAVKDYSQWMLEGNIRAIGITSHVHEYEISRFMYALATFEPKDARTSMLDRFVLLNLVNIKLLSRSFQTDILMTQAPVVSGSASVEDGANAVQATPVTAGGEAPGEMPEHISTMLTEPAMLDAEALEVLHEFVRCTTPQMRQTIMSNLAQWLDMTDSRPNKQVMQKVDSLLEDRLEQEKDHSTLQETVVAVETRIFGLVEQRDWAEISVLLEPLLTCLAEDHPEELQHRITVALDRIGERIALHGLVEEQNGNQPLPLAARKVTELLGERVVRPIVASLKHSTAMEHRSLLMQLLREFAGGRHQVLIDELRTLNPWYVYRNLLQVLAEIGGEEDLDFISEKITYPDPRVRLEAVGAAARIARERAEPYLAQGLEDAAATVRARAAALVSLCPAPHLLEILLRMVQLKTGRDEPDNVFLNACLGLGYYRQDEAREVLLQVLHPSLFSPYRKKDESIRAATVTALAQHLPHPQVEAAIKRAATDRSQIVRQMAQRVWQQFQSERKNKTTA